MDFIYYLLTNKFFDDVPAGVGGGVDMDTFYETFVPLLLVISVSMLVYIIYLKCFKIEKLYSKIEELKKKINDKNK